MGISARRRHSPEFRSTAVAFFGEQVVEQATWVTMILFAYERNGTRAAGIFLSIVLVFAVVVSPLLGRRLERFEPFTAACVLLGLLASIAGVTAVMLVVDGPIASVWIGLAVLTCCQASAPGVMFGLLPSTARDAGSLGAQHALMGWVESGALVFGPFFAATVLGRTSIRTGLTVVLLACVVVLVAVGLWLARFRVRGLGDGDPDLHPAANVSGASERELLRSPTLRTLMVATLGAYLTIGALDVLFVPVAAAAGFGERRAGLLASAYGVGAISAYLGLRLVIGRRRLVAPLCGVGVVGSLALAGLASTEGRAALAIVLVVVAGACRAAFVALTRVLVQRIAPAGSIMRVGALRQVVVTSGYAVGVMVPWLAGSTSRACIATALLLPVSLLVASRGLRRVDDSADVPVTEIALLRNVAVLRSLQPELLESVARQAEMQLHRDTPIVVEGDVGREWFVIIDGTVEVTQSGRVLRSLARGDVFGEIALVRDGVRSATVTAKGDVHVLALSGEDFTSLLGRHEHVSQAVHTLITQRP